MYTAGCYVVGMQLFSQDLFYEVHQHLEQVWAEQAQQNQQHQEQMQELQPLMQQVQQQLAGQQQVHQQEQPPQEQQQPAVVQQQQQQQPPAALLAAEEVEGPAAAVDAAQPAVLGPAEQQEEEEEEAEEDLPGLEGLYAEEVAQPARWPQPMDPGWVSPGVKARCLRYLDLTYRVTGEHLGAAGAALQQLPGLLPRVEVVDLVVPAGLVPALLLALPRLTTVTVLGLVVGVAAGKSEVELEGDTTTTAAQLAAALQPLTLLRELYLEGWQGLSPQQLAARLVGVGPAQQATPAVKLKTVQYRRCGTAGQAPTAAAAAAGQGQAVSSVPTQQQQQQQEAGVLPAWLSVQAVQQGPRPREWRPQNTPWFDQPGVEEGWAGERRPPSTLDEDQHDRMW
jgi:chemotaxis protein histidine kinase CheA